MPYLQEHDDWPEADSPNEAPVAAVDSHRPPQLEMNIIRSRTVCMCSCTRGDNVSDGMSSTTAVETDSYYNENGLNFPASFHDPSSEDLAWEAAPAVFFARTQEEVDAADLGTHPFEDIVRAIQRFRRVRSDDSMESSADAWGGPSPSASILFQHDDQEHSMADSDPALPLRASDIIRHAGGAGTSYGHSSGDVSIAVDESVQALAVKPITIALSKHVQDFPSFDMW